MRMVSSAKNYIRIHDTKKNIVPKDYQRILIFGAGGSTARLVIEKLSENLSADLANKKIQTQYYFLGSNEEDVSRKFKGIIQKEHYDAYMIFIQNDAFLLKDTYFYRELPRVLVRLNQSLGIQLYEGNDTGNSIWEAIMEMNFDFTHDKSYKNISEKIIKNMNENLLCD